VASIKSNIYSKKRLLQINGMVFMHLSSSNLINMKSILLIALVTLSFWACSDANKDNSSSTTVTDSATTSTTNDATDHSNMNMDTSGMQGKSMMSMMNSMMDNMKTMQTSGNPDNDFASMMKAHHLAAIEMAQMEVSKGVNAEMKAMAQKMIDDQQKEVAEFNTFLSGHDAHGGGDAFFKEAMSIMSNMKMEMDNAGSMDKQFVQMMISHHQSAIDMSKAYIKSGAHEEKLKTMANGIISSQQKEIGELKAWLDKNK
jgi:uncharacterized protein (DUF305 family)